MAIDGIGLPFQEAIDFFRRKVDLPTRKYDDLRHGAHVRGWSVAGVTNMEMLGDFRTAMEKARSQGTGLEEFRKDFDAIVERTGWKFYARGDTEEKRRAWRAGVIYRTNMRTSHMAGRYKQMSEPGVLAYRPWWRYRHSGAEHPRKYHLALDGKVFRATDPIWKVIFPPNGWGCGCDVEALSDRQMRQAGKTGPDPQPDWLQPYEAKDPRTGQTETRWPGVDRGWEYNVGEEALAGLVPPELAAPLKPAGEISAPVNLPPLPPARAVDAARLMPEGLPSEDYAKAFLAEFGADLDRPAFHRDPSGGIVTVDRSLFTDRKAGERDRYARVLADAVRDPDEIWVNWVTDAAGNLTLMRTYLRQVMIGTQRLGVLFGWSPRGWLGRVGSDVRPGDIEKQRRGALLYRRRQQ